MVTLVVLCGAETPATLSPIAPLISPEPVIDPVPVLAVLVRVRVLRLSTPAVPGMERSAVNFNCPLMPLVVGSPAMVPEWLRVAPPVVPDSLITRSVVSPGPL